MYPFKNIALNRNRKIIAVANPSADITQMVAKAVPGVANNYRGVWDPSGTYTNGEMVLYSNVVWLCLASTTTATPATGSTVWQAIGSYSAFLGAWSSSTAYVVGDEVTYGGNFYFCTTANTNQTPSTSSSYWQIAGPSNLDNVPDGTTYVRGLASEHTGNAWDASKAVNSNSQTQYLSAVTGNQRNLIPDSGLKNVKAYWTDNSGGKITVTQDIDGNTNAFTYIGTGAASGYLEQQSKIITVTPGAYTLSAKGLVSNVTSGAISVGVWNTALTVEYGQLNLTNSRTSTTFTIPSGVSQVVVIFNTNNATVANGQGVGVQDMQFEPGSVMTAYRENTGDNLSGTLLIDTGNSNHVGNWQHSYMSTPTKNTIATTAGGDGSYLNQGQVFNRHLNNADQAGLADDPAGNYLRWTGGQQKGLLSNHSPNHILDPTFQTVGAAAGSFWSGGTASNGVLNLGAVSASSYADSSQYDGRGNFVLIPCQPGDTIVLQLTWTQLATGTANTYLAIEFANSSQVFQVSQESYGTVQSSVLGTSTQVVPVPAGMYYFRCYMETNGGASGGNSALVTNPQVRLNHETVTDANAVKAFVDFTDNTAGGHIGKTQSNVADDANFRRTSSNYVDSSNRPYQLHRAVGGIDVSADLLTQQTEVTQHIGGQGVSTIDFLAKVTGRTADRVTYLTGGATVDSLKPAQAGADVTGSNLAKGALIPDTRSTNSAPSYYWGLGTGTYKEFKYASTISISTSQTFVALQTVVQWSDSSGGPIIQYAVAGDTTWKRQSTSSTAWSSWVDISTLAAAGSGAQLGDARNGRALFTAGIQYYLSGMGLTNPGSGQINCAAGTLLMGGSGTGNVAYNASSVTGLTNGTTYYCYYLDPGFTGGSKTLNVTTTKADLSSSPDVVYLGYITPASGGGGGGGGGGCVYADAYLDTADGSLVQAKDATQGLMLNAQLDDGTFTQLPILNVPYTVNEPCVQLVTTDGSLILSDMTPVNCAKGPFPAFDTVSETVTVRTAGKTGTDVVTGASFVGACPVVRISLGGASFGAGQLLNGYFIYTHNTLKP